MKKQVLLFVLLCAASVANAAIYFLSPDGSWAGEAGKAETSLDAALAKLTANGDVLCIAGGAYTLSAPYSVPQPNIQLYGGFDGTEVITDELSLNSALAGRVRNSADAWDFANKSVITAAADWNVANKQMFVWTKAGLVVDGLSVQNVNSNVEDVFGCTSGISSGGVFRNCLFENNNAKKAMITTYNSVLQVEDCCFRGNEASVDGNGGSVYVGGSNASRQVTVTRCLFDGNSNTAGKAASVRGQWYINVSQCVFTNHATGYAFYAQAAAGSVLTNCLFTGNKTTMVYFNGGTVTNSVFLNNEANLANFAVSKTDGTGNPCYLTNSLVLNTKAISGKFNVEGTPNYLSGNVWCYSNLSEPVNSKITDNTYMGNVAELDLTAIWNEWEYVWDTKALNDLCTGLQTWTPSVKVHSVLLGEGEDLNCTHAITATQGVEYTREFTLTGNWETIVLPFKPTAMLNFAGMDASAMFEFERFQEINADEKVVFEAVPFAELEANVPYLVRYNDEAEPELTVPCTFTAASLQPTTEWTAPLAGTYATLTAPVEGFDCYAFAVSDEGVSSFEVMADAATVAPYRAYLRMATADTNPARYAVLHANEVEDPTEITASATEGLRLWGAKGQLCIEAGMPQQIDVYAVDGRLVRSEWVDGQTVLSLPAGFYLVNGQKLTVR
ncbi:MAG: hypothetical protein ACI36X_08270 [Bacteroidaceae bacterium]